MGFWKSFKQAAGITAGLYVGWNVIGKTMKALFDGTGNAIMAMYEGGIRGLCKKVEEDADDLYGKEDESSTEEEES